MSAPEQQPIPFGFKQLTEGWIRRTDLVFGSTGGWDVPHVFAVGSDVAKDGRRFVRPMGEPKKPRVRS